MFNICNFWCVAVVTAVLATVIAVFATINFTMSVPASADSIGDNSAENMEKLRAAAKTAFVVGYTGETGKELVKAMAASKVFSKVTLIGRRKVEYSEEMLKDFNVEQQVVDFEKLDESADVFKGHDMGFCCLGTTKAKSGAEGFKRVDRDYILKTAELAKSGGVSHFHLVSSGGADAKSRILYLQVKGEVDDTVRDMGFDKTSIYRPAVLMCDRTESRGSEWLLRKMLAPMESLAPGVITSSTATVAKAILHVAAGQEDKHVIYNSKAIQRITMVNKKK